jgi:inorganic triphosphatase YgiF
VAVRRARPRAGASLAHGLGPGRPWYTVAATGTVTQSDTYLDTEDQRFARAGFALRIRRLGRRRGAEATLKAIDSTPTKVSGLRSRREVSEQVEDAEPALLARAGGPVGERVRAVAGRKPLLPLFEVRTRREVLTLQANGSAQGEIALDETAIRPANGSPTARFQRVEIEIPESALPTVDAFVTELRAHCALQPAGLSKYEAGLLSAGIPRPAAERFGPTVVDPTMTIRAVALAVLRRHFSTMLAKEPGTRLGDDIEDLHDMRVASRRLRAALALFEDVLPETIVGLKDELAWIGGQLGAVRDLDVQLEQLELVDRRCRTRGPRAARGPSLGPRRAARRRTPRDARGARVAPVRLVRPPLRAHAAGPPCDPLRHRVAAGARGRARPDRRSLGVRGQGREAHRPLGDGGGLSPAADPLQAIPLRARVPD